jgi:hypothetical protein
MFTQVIPGSDGPEFSQQALPVLAGVAALAAPADRASADMAIAIRAAGRVMAGTGILTSSPLVGRD